MKKKIKKIAKGRIVTNQSGFTLLEVIISLIIASILGSIAYQLMGTNIVKSALPINRVKDQFELNGMVEDMTADYRNFVVISANISNEPGDTNLIDFKEYIESKYSESSCEYIQPEDPENTGDPALNHGERILKVTFTKGDQTVTTIFTRW